MLSGTAAAEDTPHVDNTPPGFDERPVAPPPVVLPAAAATPPARVFKQPPPPVAPAVASTPAPAAAPPPPVDEVAAPEQPYEPAELYEPAEPYNRYAPPDDWERRGSGMSPLAIGGFVLLGVLAIAVGAFVSGIFSGGAAVESPSGTPITSSAPSVSLAPSLAPSAPESQPATTPNPSGGPVVFPDGFTARTEPCADEPTTEDGCNSSGATISGGSVWVWVGFRKGNDTDVLDVTVVDASGSAVGDGSLSLGSIGCGDSCSGWGRFKFSSLGVGNYTIRVNRNGQLAAQATFTVTG